LAEKSETSYSSSSVSKSAAIRPGAVGQEEVARDVGCIDARLGEILDGILRPAYNGRDFGESALSDGIGYGWKPDVVTLVSCVADTRGQ
jgi:hypothetical protein